MGNPEIKPMYSHHGPKGSFVLPGKETVVSLRKFIGVCLLEDFNFSYLPLVSTPRGHILMRDSCV